MGYLVPATTFESPHESFIEIRKSRFLAQSFRVVDPSSAKTAIEARKALYPDASHNCWAYLAGPTADTARIGSSDDGEPHGTAGRPILNVLLHGGIGEIAMVVTRWFGGIKLGTGGLVRAYQESALSNLKELPTDNYTPSCRAKIKIAYSYIDPIRRILPEYGASVEDEKYSDMVEMILRLPLDSSHALSAQLASLSNGKASFELFYGF